MEEVTIKIGGMSCGGCVKNVTNVLEGLPGVKTAAVTLESGEARVSYDPSLLDAQALCTAIEDAGFDAAL